MFYSDNIIVTNEKNNLFEETLLYLENKYKENPTSEIIASLIGFSWTYYVDEILRVLNFESELALKIWTKYITIAKEYHTNSPEVCFITGYTIILHGFFLEEYKSNYQEYGLNLIRVSYDNGSENLKVLSKIILENNTSNKQKQYDIDNNQFKKCLNELFTGNTIIENYFKEMKI